MLPNLPPRPLVYLAGPYYSEDAVEMQVRMVTHQKVACELAQRGMSVISPIAQWAPIAKYYMRDEIHMSRNFWMEQDLPLLIKCDAMVLLPLLGWNESSGTGAEIAIAEARHIAILVYEPKGEKLAGVGGNRKWAKLKLSPSSFYLEH